MKLFGNYFFALALLTAGYSNAQSSIDTIQSNGPIPKTLINKLKGVKYANMYRGELWEQQYVNNTASIDSELMVGIAMFLKTDLDYQVAIKEEQLVQLQAGSGSPCEFTNVAFTGKFDSDAFSEGGIIDPSLSFSFCDGSTYTVLLSDYKASKDAEQYDQINEQLQQRFR